MAPLTYDVKSTLANAYMDHLLKVNLITIRINSNELNNDIKQSKSIRVNSSHSSTKP